jgi:hypothetical protein
MTVTGKHKEILIELLIHHLANQYYNGNHEKVDMTGDYWVKQFIDTPNAYWDTPNAYWWSGQEFGLDDYTNKNIK